MASPLGCCRGWILFGGRGGGRTRMPKGTDFKSAVYTNSTTRAMFYMRIYIVLIPAMIAKTKIKCEYILYFLEKIEILLWSNI